jgi:hypothetical protein
MTIYLKDLKLSNFYHNGTNSKWHKGTKAQGHNGTGAQRHKGVKAKHSISKSMP